MLKLDTVDSTNNYAMRLIDADKAAHGLTILANEQTAGKGQRGKSWAGAPGESLLMSIVLTPCYKLHQQPLFLASVAVSVAEVVQRLVPQQSVCIKWPNDIFIGDKKAGGILVENIVRGQIWQWAVVGIGLNVGQRNFPASLPDATSLRIAAAENLIIEAIASQLREGILKKLSSPDPEIIEEYNKLLYRFGKDQQFKNGNLVWKASVRGMNDQGQLMVSLSDGSIQQYTHGTVEWVLNNDISD